MQAHDHPLPNVILPDPLTAPLSDAFVRSIFDETVGSIHSIISADETLIYVNRGFANSFNVTPAQLLGKRLSEVYEPAHYATFLPFLQRALGGEIVTYDRLGRNVGNAGVWHTICLMPIRNEAGSVIAIAHSAMRVHELKVAMESLRVANERLSSHIDNSPLTVIEFDDQQRISRCSAQIFDLLGLTAEAVVGLSIADVLKDSANVQPLTDAFSRLRSASEVRNWVELALTHADGSTVYCEWFNSALTAAAGGVGSMMALVHNTTERNLAQAQLQRIATRDPLTGLLNRRALLQRLDQAIARNQRDAQPLAIIFVDLNGFKAINDQFGHGVGDDVLCAIASRLVDATRECDVVARLGGDEFVVLAETGVSDEICGRLKQRIATAIHPPIMIHERALSVGAAIGSAICPPSSADAMTLLRRADEAMYLAKRQQKNH